MNEEQLLATKFHNFLLFTKATIIKNNFYSFDEVMVLKDLDLYTNTYKYKYNTVKP